MERIFCGSEVGGWWLGYPVQVFFSRVSDGSPKSITFTAEEDIIYNKLIGDNSQTVSWFLLEEFSLI